jgi:hypothetical protein
MSCRCKDCLPVVGELTKHRTPSRPVQPITVGPLSIAELVRHAEQRAEAKERLRCSNVALLFPLENFAYNGDTGELLRLRDAISQAIEKMVHPGKPIE